MNKTLKYNKKVTADGSFPSMIDVVEQMRHWSAVKTGDIRIMNAEMQLIRTVGRHDGISAGDAAKELGITKGAVSQTMARLDKKGSFILREQDPENASKLRLHLGEDGCRVHEAHERYHRELDALEQDLLRVATPAERAFLEKYLRTICEKLEQEHVILGDYLK
ncbi:MAG: MarR family transcriptional regulator [Lachnospiraceae bacterium]|nr:MarR family transcriptional regulator [Lachnospiraceae bacterium]